MDSPFASLLKDFVDESLPLAERVADVAVELDRLWSGGQDDSEALRSLKGDLHTLKGNAGMMGLDAIQRLAHQLEDLLAAIRDGRVGRVPAAADLFGKGGEVLAASIRAALIGPLDPAPAMAVVRTIEDFASGRAVAAAPVADELAPTAAVADDTVRFDLHKLDRLMALVGELSVRQTEHLADWKRLASALPESERLELFEARAAEIARGLDRLREQLLEARLVSIARLFGRFPRYVRTLARELGKSIRVELAGEETRLDKAVADGVAESLLHLVRNAADHGLETAKARTAAGKRPEGTIRLQAALEGDAVRIDVVDDGRGFDHDAIRKKAEALGIPTAGLERHELERLVFRPGFTTAQEVSLLSGRGVGLDVVAAAVQGLGGSLDIRSEPGVGTIFRLRLPLTLSVTRVLLVRVGASRYAIPVQHVLEALELDRDRVAEIRRKGVTLWRHRSLVVADGAGFGPYRPSRDRERKALVVLGTGERFSGLAVDALLGHQNVVLERLDELVGQPFGIAGTTILGDGRVTLVLDAPGIVSGPEVAAAVEA